MPVLINALLGLGADVNCHMGGSLIDEEEGGSLEISSKTPLERACDCRSLATVKTLLEYGANPLLHVSGRPQLEVYMTRYFGDFHSRVYHIACLLVVHGGIGDSSQLVWMLLNGWLSHDITHEELLQLLDLYYAAGYNIRKKEPRWYEHFILASVSHFHPVIKGESIDVFLHTGHSNSTDVNNSSYLWSGSRCVSLEELVVPGCYFLGEETTHFLLEWGLHPRGLRDLCCQKIRNSLGAVKLMQKIEQLCSLFSLSHYITDLLLLKYATAQNCTN